MEGKSEVRETKYNGTRSNLDESKYVEDSDEDEENYQFKIILLGDGAVGKTSIATRFTQDQFAKHYKQTIGLDFFIKRLVLPGGVNATVQVWDIGGQSIGSKMLRNYIHGAHAVLLCYDVTNYQSFQNLEDWYRLVQQAFAGKALPLLGLVANKADLNHIRTVKMEKHHQFADENDMTSFSMSARTGDKVHACFHSITAELAGVVLSKPEIQVSQQVVKAEIVNHQQNDPEVDELTNGGTKCVLQ